MSDKKNIDRLFQEKFKDFEVTPDDAVWEKIKARQNKNRRRGILIPFWYRVAGVAALVAILFTVGYNVSFDDANPTEEKIVTNTKDTDSPEDAVTSKEEQNNTTTQDVVISPDENKKLKDSDPSTEQFTNSSRTTNSKDAIVSNTIKEKLPVNNKNVNPPIFSEDKVNTKNSNALATNKSSNDKNAITKNNSPENSDVLKEDLIEKNAIAENQKQSPKQKEENPLFVNPDNKNDNIAKTGIAINDKNSETIPGKESETQNQEEKTVEENSKISIFDAINKDEEEALAENSEPSKKWNVSPNIAPVYYDSFGNGSSIDGQFSDNGKTGQVNLSYGVQISYNVNKKLSIRSGVHKVDLGYNTEGVGFAPSVVAQNLENINYNANSTSIFVSDFRNTPPSLAPDVNNDALQNQNEGLLNQRIGYLEVPLEMKYNLVDKKIGINMIGGVSTLFLQDNEISIEAGDFKTPIGQANNLNNISFSGNIGLGFDYEITKEFQINLEPIFKYQFNAFDESANSFRPYYFGVYTGVSFKF
ncbi:hypothetical protein [Aquimarina sp. 2201CG5-10]|uniref:hypothetical protein n=1 Tax=Aquimarina callyspongiae TaxID=3098150 RepID=UPI002AB425AE|nr:hypothetical protein [Aquimarina sp. 2201CG5-10]MDY8137174.1 hypothetical protein [Aquimarina sp. 2201CG5-10]